MVILKNIVSCQWLFDHIDDDEIFIFDCQFDLFDASNGIISYECEHLPKAFYLDLNKDLSGTPSIHGGARPVADSDLLFEKLRNLGVRSNSTLIVYDANFYSSPRAWWQLKFMGFENVYVLNGGLSAWKALNFPTSKDYPKIEPSPYPINLKSKSNLLASIDSIKPILNESVSFNLIDARNFSRFTGEKEPLYSKKGHIPHSINLPWDSFVTFENLLMNPRNMIDTTLCLDSNKTCITYCGSGIEGAIAMLALDEMGFNASLYVGSMSDWISYDELPVWTGPL